jgi:hypothetical protein
MGEPITVGGGGGLALSDAVYCDFNETVYTDQTGGGGRKHRTFANNGFTAKKLQVTLNGNMVDLSALLPATGECEVEVKCPGNDDDVKMNGRPLGIKLHTGVYADPDPASGHPHRRPGPNKANEIKITIADQVIQIQPRGDFEVTLEEE